MYEGYPLTLRRFSIHRQVCYILLLWFLQICAKLSPSLLEVHIASKGAQKTVSCHFSSRNYFLQFHDIGFFSFSSFYEFYVSNLQFLNISVLKKCLHSYNDEENRSFKIWVIVLQNLSHSRTNDIRKPFTIKFVIFWSKDPSNVETLRLRQRLTSIRALRIDNWVQWKVLYVRTLSILLL